jgi:hypothetical protein
VSAHQITIETRPKTGRKIDPPRSSWSCSCGAGGRGRLMSPEQAHREADEHTTPGA